jgi:adenine-specific DNA glycosylase
MLKQHWRVLVIKDNGDLLIRQRPRGELNAGLWEFPTLESENDRAPANWATALAGMPVKRPQQLAKLSHSITRYRIQIGVWQTGLRGPRPNGHWMAKTTLSQIPLAGAHRKVLRTIQAAE